MAFSSLPNFIHFPTSISISNSSLPPPSLPPSSPLSAKRRGSLCVKCHGGGPDPEKKDNGHEKDPLETIAELYKGIKNKDVAHLADVIDDQYPNKKSDFLSNIIKGLQNSLIFNVQPTTKDGSMVGIKWRVGWNKPLMESGKGVRIYSHHTYVGKLLIGNLETIIDPLLRLGPKTLKNWNWVPRKQRKVPSLCLGFFLLVLSLFFFQFSVR